MRHRDGCHYKRTRNLNLDLILGHHEVCRSVSMFCVRTIFTFDGRSTCSGPCVHCGSRKNSGRRCSQPDVKNTVTRSIADRSGVRGSHPFSPFSFFFNSHLSIFPIFSFFSFFHFFSFFPFFPFFSFFLFFVIRVRGNPSLRRYRAVAREPSDTLPREAASLSQLKRTLIVSLTVCLLSSTHKSLLGRSRLQRTPHGILDCVPSICLGPDVLQH